MSNHTQIIPVFFVVYPHAPLSSTSHFLSHSQSLPFHYGFPDLHCSAGNQYSNKELLIHTDAQEYNSVTALPFPKSQYSKTPKKKIIFVWERKVVRRLCGKKICTTTIIPLFYAPKKFITLQASCYFHIDTTSFIYYISTLHILKIAK